MTMNVTELCINCKQNNSCTMCWKTSNKKCPHFIQKTNADKIRSMTDDELALWICGVYDIEEEHGKFINGTIIPGYAPHDVEEWLQQPAEEIDNG